MAPRKKMDEVEDIFAPSSAKRVKIPKRTTSSARAEAPRPERHTIVLQSMTEDRARREERTTRPMQNHIALYRNIALGFFVVTLLLLGGIFFTSVRKATVDITYTPAKISFTDVVQLGKNRGQDGRTVAGSVEVKTVTLTKTYTPSGSEKLEIPITGVVRIKNESARSQPLVKTTRLLAADGKLYRLTKSVVVPAAGELKDVEVYADVAGPGQAVAAGTNLTIPGLWEPVQKKIYAIADAELKGGIDERGVVSQSDVQKAEADIRAALVSQAQGDVQNTEANAAYNISSVTLDGLQVERKAEPGKTVGPFAITARAKAVVVRYNGSQLADLVRARIATQPVEPYAKVDFDAAQMTVRVESYDTIRGEAQLSLLVPLVKMLRADAGALAPEQFAGKTREDIDALVKEFQGVENVRTDVTFFPYWISKVPSVGGTVEVQLHVVPETSKK